MDFKALLEQVMHRLADAHVRLDPAHDRLLAPAQIEAIGARRRKDGLLQQRLPFQPHLGGRVAQPLGVLLADDSGQIEDPCRLQQLAGGVGHRGEGLIRPEGLLHVDDDEGGTIAAEQAHAAAIGSSARSR